MEETVRVADRIFDILEVLAASNSPLGLSELAKATHMSKSTIHRLAASMCARQYVEKSSDGLYSIGYKLIETVSLHINQLELLTEAKPFLSDIMRDLDLTAHLGILDTIMVGSDRSSGDSGRLRRGLSGKNGYLPQHPPLYTGRLPLPGLLLLHRKMPSGLSVRG